MTVLLELFWSFFQIGLFSVGGGYAAMPLIQHQVVDLHGWMTMQEFIDIITISQMTPDRLPSIRQPLSASRLQDCPALSLRPSAVSSLPVSSS